jgi:hypothetical protein
MDGNAESYLLYGFVHMPGITCTSGEKKFVIDLSEMEDSDLAYGMFASNRDPNQAVAKIAMGGQVQGRRASFAKGKYYVEIAASPDGDYSAQWQAFVSKMEPIVPGEKRSTGGPGLVSEGEARVGATGAGECVGAEAAETRVCGEV